jgi:hypothetical protein
MNFFFALSRFYSLLLEAEIDTESCQDYCLAFISSFEDDFQQVLLDWILENAKRQDVPLVSSQPFSCPKNRSFLVKLIPDNYHQFYWCFGNDWRILNGLWFDYNDDKETAPNTSIKTRQHRNPNMSNGQKRPRDFSSDIPPAKRGQCDKCREKRYSFTHSKYCKGPYPTRSEMEFSDDSTGIYFFFFFINQNDIPIIFSDLKCKKDLSDAFSEYD